MREYKFRGKCNDERSEYYGQWVYGNLSIKENGFCQIENMNDPLHWWVWVDPESVGQYTGLKDKNGKEIYKGDIFNNGNFNVEIYYEESTASFLIRGGFISGDDWAFSAQEIEIIGNIAGDSWGNDSSSLTPKRRYVNYISPEINFQ